MKKKLLEQIHAFRYIILAALILLNVLVAISSFDYGIIGKIISAGNILSIYFIIESSFLRFKTNHNLAQLVAGDTLLNYTFGLGDFIIVLPFYNIVEEKDGVLLDVNELSMVLPSKEMQFGGEKKDSIFAKNIQINYYIDRNDVYKYLTVAPKDYRSTILENASGDIGSAFLKRVKTLEEAQDFKDILFISFGSKKWNERPSYVNKSGFWLVLDDSGTSSLFSDDPKKRFISELATTIARMESFGIYPSNITIGDFQDSSKTEDSRNAIQQQNFENIRLKNKNEARMARIDIYAEKFEKAGYAKLVAYQMAREEVKVAEGSRTEIGTDGNSNLLLNVDKK
jgi:hypothetical protein